MSNTFLRRLFVLALCACLVLLAVLPAGADFGDYSGMPKVVAALEKHFTDDEIEKICWKNAYRVIGESMK